MDKFQELHEARDHKAELEKRLVYFAGKGDEQAFMKMKLDSVEFFVQRGFDERGIAIKSTKAYRAGAERIAKEKYIEYSKMYKGK